MLDFNYYRQKLPAKSFTSQGLFQKRVLKESITYSLLKECGYAKKNDLKSYGK